MSVHPIVSWAQRKDCVLLTVDIQDAENVEVKVTDSLAFSAAASGKKYAFDIPLFAEVVAEESSNVTRARAVEIKLVKKDTEAEFWPRLSKEKTKNPKLQIDWNRWKDEDEVDANENLGDFGGMPGMGGAGGMPGMPGMGGAGGAGGMDMAAMQQMLAGMQGGAGGMPGMDGMGMPPMGEDRDSDDEDEMPPLEQ